MPSRALPENLAALLGRMPDAALAFSGGVDSAYLLYAALQAGVKLTAYYVDTPFQPAFERRDTQRLADELGAPLTVLPFDILSVPEVAANPPDRCYHCKRQIMGRILAAAKVDGHTLLMDGSNASDDAGDRPGMRALDELAVRSPLREAGISKAEVRALSKRAGLFTWNKPAYACLATRIPAGTTLDRAALARVEAAEEALFALGFSDFRCRVREGGALLQFTPAQHPLALARWQAIADALTPYYANISLDPTPRPGENYANAEEAP